MKDYIKYHIQGSDHYLIPSEEFEELLDRIDKAIEYINEEYDDYEEFIYGKEFKMELLKILKGENNEN